MEFPLEVNESSVRPKELMIAIEAEGCTTVETPVNTVKTQSVSMKTRALEMPKITLESVDFIEEVISLLYSIIM